ncbi:hypothetical protein FHR22_001986 [Sphingopyxis panaciterrae]|uniref:hypothetical protein n=1 Tax=Sphingopyxis panaciterrae TaxID=363841 RepID=UPI00141EB2A6|nr:hypothetical protein [Sphingopyxis panaciterrae]NIJ37302.1 hypothetical protein [Sphingopyxis panaciterrae]
MVKFDMGAAWEDSVTLLKSHTALTGTIAAVFLFLPTLAVSWFGPAPIEPAAGATFQQMMTSFQESARQAIPYQLLVAVIAAIGGVGILRLWLSRSSVSVGDALAFAFKMIPTMIAVQFLMGLAVGLVAVVLIVPGAALGGAPGMLLLFVGLIAFIALCAYLWGRVAVAPALIADRIQYNPAAVLQESWSLTRGNGWRIFLFLFLVTLVVGIAGLIVGLIVGAIGGTGEGAGRMLMGLAEAGFAAISGIVTLAISAAAYRQLSVGGASDIFQ